MASRRIRAPLWPVLNLLIASMVPVHSLTLTISPERAHLNMAGDNLTVMCQASEPIKRCQFNFWKDEPIPQGPLLDLSLGAATPLDPLLLSDTITGYTYSGTGLKAGQCGVRLSLKGWKRYMLGCRVKGETGGWRYAIMSFTADQSASIPVIVTPKSAVVLPGSNITLLCKAGGPLDWCRFDSPGDLYNHLFLDQGAQSKHSTSEHLYYGAGVQKGECGITYTSVSERLNGYAFCGLVTTAGHWERLGIPVVVARAPDTLKLDVTSPSISAGSFLEATCTVGRGRPAANITWYMDDEIIRNDDEDDSPGEEWGWPTSLQKITQRLRYRLKESDNGRVLRCEGDHVALSRLLNAKRTISFIKCRPLISQTVLVSCFLAGEEVNCDQPQEFGTEARLVCKPGYQMPTSVVYRKTSCLRGGTWSRPVFTCHPDCGRRKSNAGESLISGGKDGQIAEFPWHIGIYLAKPGTGNIIQICGGTLISPTVVASAAHCFWNFTSERKNEASHYKVAAGKHAREWDVPEPSVQKRNVSEIVLHQLFRGRNTGFQHDIGILRLETAVDINPKVNLICVDWENTLERQQLTPGKSGVVTGWGYTEDGVQSTTLKYVDLPFVSSETCLDSLTRPQQQLFSSDKFCAGFVNKSTSVCRGDSGGGLVFRDPGTDRYYLRGIVSVSFRNFADVAICYSQHYTAFTIFSQYITWVQDNV